MLFYLFKKEIKEDKILDKLIIIIIIIIIFKKEWMHLVYRDRHGRLYRYLYVVLFVDMYLNNLALMILQQKI